MIPDNDFPMDFTRSLSAAADGGHSTIPHYSDQSQPEDPQPTDPHTETPSDAKSTPSQVFNHHTRFQYCHLLRQGLTKGAAARLLGVSPRTIQLAAKTDPDLADRIRQARLECHATAAANIARAGEKSWRAAAWLLERGRRRRGRCLKDLSRPRNSPRLFADPLAREEMKGLVRNVLLEVMPELRKEITAKRNSSSPLAEMAAAAVASITTQRDARFAALSAEVKAIRAAGQTPNVETLWRKHFPGVPLPPYAPEPSNLARNSAHPNAQSSPAPISPSAFQNDATQQVATTTTIAAEPAIAQNP